MKKKIKNKRNQRRIITAKEVLGLLSLLGLLEGVWGLLERVLDWVWPLFILLSEIICMVV